MKIRILTLACVATAAALLAACTTVYRNSDACEQLMRSKLAETSSDTLKIGHTGAGIGGSRVVVEGAIEHGVTASEAAGGASGASGASRASGAAGASAASSLSRAASGSATSAASGAATAAGATASGVGAAAASPSASSDAQALALKSGKPKKIVQAAAAECTFHGPTLATFSWLAPAKLAAPSEPDSGEAQE
ncbi:hypothetical protein [Paraburkholderia phenoliruptrix]|uniref:Lipoprotein n=2 Tax=Paraburkholderia phenoliruptrix TaxID=252970 RepID=A0A6J5KDP7_9BURK|nr:hypothetical protein [Paraburkholderia phenoliruptrix]AFT86530.1 hypothetical protein BUPH_02954 [Paraburkholderia phenoliruptrix BR3459a]MDR6389297.1 cobalamin biosynthesis Mg chelatase CobN [Paraburkholderia phenoliruptrix]CAB4051442.1 hypothetical protein LMG9964_05121 [Paraburkholderia phenoliruptrix]